MFSISQNMLSTKERNFSQPRGQKTLVRIFTKFDKSSAKAKVLDNLKFDFYLLYSLLILQPNFVQLKL